MIFKLNDIIVWLGADNQTLKPTLKQGLVTKLGKSELWVDLQHGYGEHIKMEYCFLDTPENRTKIQKEIEAKQVK